MLIPNWNTLSNHEKSEPVFKRNWSDFFLFLTKKYGDISLREKMYLYLNNMDEVPRCKCCESKVKFYSFARGFAKFCGSKCSNKYNAKYGNENIFSKDETKRKIKQTLINRYGVDTPMHNPESVQKIKDAKIIKYGVNYASIISKNVSQNKNDFIVGYTEDGDWICKCPHPGCNKCESQTYIINTQAYHGRQKWNTEPCTNIMPLGSSTSTPESEISDWLNDLNISHKCSDRTILDGLELDIYISSKQLAIEFNGCYWHCDKKKDKRYHYAKYKMCKEKGIQLIQIWEDWYHNDKDKVKSLILSKLGIYSKRLYARKCDIRKLTNKDIINFENTNHIQGHTNAQIIYGLYYDNELVSCMSFSEKRRQFIGSKAKEDKTYELLRFCSLRGYQIIGGMQKMISHFIKDYNPSKIISYSSNDISNGNVYIKAGFTKSSKEHLSYWYINKNNLIRYHRSKFCKTNLKKMGYDISRTETEIMGELPYFKIYDSGTTQWILSITQ